MLIADCRLLFYMPPIAKIVKSNSHVDYVARVIDELDADEPPAPEDYGFAQFVAVPLAEGEEAVGVVYDTQLANPDYASFGPRLSSHAELKVLSPDFLHEQGVLLGILLVGWRSRAAGAESNGQGGGAAKLNAAGGGGWASHQGVPRRGRLLRAVALLLARRGARGRVRRAAGRGRHRTVGAGLRACGAAAPLRPEKKPDLATHARPAASLMAYTARGGSPMKNAARFLCAAAVASTTLAAAPPAQRPPAQTQPPARAQTNAPKPASAPPSVKAKYEGGVVGYRKSDGTINFDDTNSRLAFHDKQNKELFSIPYKAVVMAWPDTRSSTSTT